MGGRDGSRPCPVGVGVSGWCWGFWIVGRGRGAAVGQAEQRPAERRLGLAAHQRRVDPGGRAGQAVRAQRCVPGPGRVRAPGRPVTAADQAKAAADAQRFAAIQDVTGKVVGPVPSQDGQALQVVVPVRVAEEGNGWEELAPGSRRCARSPRPTPWAWGCDRAGGLRRLQRGVLRL